MRISSLARQRAESHCARAIRESEALKADLITIAKKLREAEKKQACICAESNRIEILRLEKLSAEKDVRLRGLRESLIKLKAQFVLCEQTNSTRKKETNATGAGGTHLETSKYLQEEANHLTQELYCIRKEAKATRRQLDVARAQRDKYKKQFEDMLAELDHSRSNSRTSESRCRELDDSLIKARRDCRNLRIREAEFCKGRLAEQPGTQKCKPESDLGVLRAQNVALRKVCLNKSATWRDSFKKSLLRLRHIVQHQSLRIKHLQTEK